MFRALSAALLICSPLHAQSPASMRLATDLGTLLGSERACNLSFDHAAVGDWIDANVDASDMSFASTLAMMTQGAEFQMQEMQGSARVAHCRSVERTARHYLFIRQ